jgi:hypothetical protein
MTTRDLLSAPSARSLLVGGGALVALAAVTLAGDAARPVASPVVVLPAREPVAAVREVEVALEAEPSAPAAPAPLAALKPMDLIADPADFAFIVEIGGTTYMSLGDFVVDADRDDAVLVEDDFATSAIAPVSASPLSEELRPWINRRVLVGGTCAATVIGFAEIGQVSGDPYVLSDDPDRASVRWTVESAFAHGNTMIAAELDGDCSGSWARAADRPAVARALAVTDPRLEGAARRAFLASSHADRIASDWRRDGQPGDWRDLVPPQVRVVEHASTGARWIYVHARMPGNCGDYDVNVAAIYRVAADGALTEVETDDFPGNILEELVDLNGDGWFERIVGQRDPVNRTLVAPTDRTTLAALEVPFLGCGC